LMRALTFAAAAALLVAAAPTQAQQFPQRPITMIVPFAAGGPTDVLARVLGQHMSQTLGQSIVVEDVTGAGGTLGSARAAKAAPDGYRSEEHTSALQSPYVISYAVFCLKKTRTPPSMLMSKACARRAHCWTRASNS